MNTSAQPTAIIEMDIERDRKTCVALDLKVTGANRELAQWLLDHPRYSGVLVAEWLGCGSTRIKDLRLWAQDGFKRDPSQKRRERDDRRRAGQEPLKPQEDSDSDDIKDDDGSEVADAATVEDSALYTLARINEHARAFKKIFKLSSFDRGANERISTAIDRMILKWRSTQATLTPKGGQQHE